MRALVLIATLLMFTVAASAQFGFLGGSKSVSKWERVETSETVWPKDSLICSASDDSTGTTTYAMDEWPYNGISVVTQYDTAITGNVVCDRVIVQVCYNYMPGGTYDDWIAVDTLTAAIETYLTQTPQAFALPATKPWSMQVRHYVEDSSTCKAFAKSKFIVW